MSGNNEKEEKVIHLIANAHLDPVWLWSLPEGLGEAVATCRIAVELLEAYSGYVFTRGEALVYQWVEEVAPELFEKIRRFVKSGRWHIVNGWIVQPDCNLPCGESFVRQALYGKRYFKEKFGIEVKIGYCVDAFGHNAGLPQILKKSGYQAYLFFRPAKHELTLPGSIFSWEGVDGSRILAIRPDGSYMGEKKQLESKIQQAAREIPQHSGHGLCFIGVGDHGGGATREIIKAIEKLRNKKGMPELRFSNLEKFIQEYLKEKPEIPGYKGELQHHSPGCYSTLFEVKKLNRSTEHLLLTAEKFTTLEKAVSSQKFPRNSFKDAWEGLLFNQFHDVLPGSSIPEAYEDISDIFGFSRRMAKRELWASLQKISEKIDTRGEGVPVVIFNPHSWPVKAPVEIEWMLDYRPKEEKFDRILVKDDKGKNVLAQLEETSAVVTWQWRKKVSFIAEIPAFGYRVYRLIASPGDFGTQKSKKHPIEVKDRQVENEFFKLTWDSKNQLVSLYDKKREAEVLSGAAGEFIVIKDDADTWGHDKSSFREEVGRFNTTELEILERGPVRAVVRTRGTFNKSEVETEWVIYHSLPYIDLKVRVNWQEKHRMLKMSFPLNISSQTNTAEIPYGAIERPANGMEEPMLQWVEVSETCGKNKKYGVSLATNSLCGYDIKDGEIRLTVLRSPLYAHHIPATPSDTKRPRYMNQGLYTFECRIIPHPGEWQKAKVINLSQEINQPPISFVTHSHPGALPGENSWITIKPDNVILISMKPAEERDNLILRLFEATGRKTSAQVSLSFVPLQIESSWEPFEIKTISLDPKKKQWQEVNLMEE
ncbi:MAG: alpha-mannosidase [Caldiserica bacterium]|nr:alpha-mannosidase [Caldisericota bacterium]